ncbi:MAG: NUDIX hydrolase [Gammaproteobacteria bacterium]|nr:NUDIX hydrolase [Gammaproteobacteria bacterium]
MNKQLAPELTVAALAEHQGKFLMIEERVNGVLVINQPAGHLENCETLVDAVARECFEESGWQFEATDLCSIFSWVHPRRNVTVVRFVFCGTALNHDPAARLDDGVLRALWMTPNEIFAQRARLRSPMVEQAVRDYLDGKRFPLDLVTHIDHPTLMERARRTAS